jgi:hypothetical protein
LRVAVVLALASWGAAIAQPRPAIDATKQEAISVCELLRNIAAYRGKVVSIRGIYWYGLRAPCAEPLITKGHKWPSALNLAAADAPRRGGEFPPLTTDLSSWNHLDEFVLREAKTGRRKEIWITVVGLVRAPTTYIRDNGAVVGGYGHLGVFPAELVVQRISDISVVPTPTYDYAEMVRRHGAAE